MSKHLLNYLCAFEEVLKGATISAILVIGVKESTMFNNVFTALNIVVLSFIIIAGILHDKPSNWNISAAEVANQTCTQKGDPCGSGGFAPYGFNGIVQGAATAFFAFVGFDAIATTGEEARNPQRNIPISISISLGIIFIFYFLISLTVLQKYRSSLLVYFHLPDDLIEVQK